jgi:predicted RNA-binding protein
LETPYDALLILEATLLGILQPIGRRLNPKERMHVKSGDIYVYEESRSGIKRWTEGRVWSPSRILGQFLVYREVDKDARKEFKSAGLIKKTISFQNQLENK